MAGGRHGASQHHTHSNANSRHHGHARHHEVVSEELGQQHEVQQRIGTEIRRLPAIPQDTERLDDMHGVAESMEKLSKIRRQRTETRHGNRHPERHPLLASQISTDIGDLSGVAHLEPVGDSSPGETSPDSPQLLISASSRDKEKMHRHGKRRKHSHSSHYLSKENERLRDHASKLEELLEQAGAGQRTLEKDLEEAQRHRLELEKLAHEGLVCGTVAATVGENAYLRKQLSAYAVEIDVLRKENEHLCKELEAARNKEKELQDANKKLVDSKNEISIALAQAGETTKQQVGSHMAAVAEKDQRLQDVIWMAKCYKDAWTSLHHEFVIETKKHNSIAKRLRQLQRHYSDDLEEFAEKYQDAHHGLHGHSSHLSSIHRMSMRALTAAEQAKLAVEARSLDETLQAEAQDAKMTTRSKRLPPDDLRELEEMASNGLVLQKKSQRSGSMDIRWACIASVPKRPFIRQLIWRHHKANGKGTPLSVRVKHTIRRRPNDTIINLEDVVRIEYGNCRPCTPKGKCPWHCVTVYTRHRPFTFVCHRDDDNNRDDDTRCLVLVLSRHCTNAVGAIPSRHAFEVTKGWCKIADGCYQKGISPAKSFLAACRQYAAQCAATGVRASVETPDMEQSVESPG
mmetsp:Transcript_125675/g.199190  ORF Transcript_125675/g.199190 Transcript_125675/m.199190 type:complete len:629 (-) Transcript_125675:101-1987(-)|eukprot:CAMPEP_0169224732 /NCGR_PEP_ID=MMETSP1016-20121227/22823_1 /TAXON_ID=342587 /ORGANISM="Karlodinium micrum, Strain CCMP2283" /LENGTH=628 /DNA_ID=CAMNT_0009303195 /DNA_START=20 /DNA_END=1906 /DNA_ORIENTATION=+